MTEAGETAFLRLRTAAVAFDRQLRLGVSDDEVARLEGLLDRFARNVGADGDGSALWTGLLGTAR